MLTDTNTFKSNNTTWITSIRPTKQTDQRKQRQTPAKPSTITQHLNLYTASKTILDFYIINHNKQMHFNNKIYIKTVLMLCIICLMQSYPLGELQEKSRCDFDCCRSLNDRSPMVYTYYQKTGRFVGGSGQYAIDTHGYSGQKEGYLNPDLQCKSNIGPLPASTYKISFCKNKMHETAQKPCSFYLDPQNPEQICGRSDFFIHGCQCCTSGDDLVPPAAGCSAGCVIISFQNRRKLRLGDTLIVKHYQSTQNDQKIASQ